MSDDRCGVCDSVPSPAFVLCRRCRIAEAEHVAHVASQVRERDAEIERLKGRDLDDFTVTGAELDLALDEIERLRSENNDLRTRLGLPRVLHHGPSSRTEAAPDA